MFQEVKLTGAYLLVCLTLVITRPVCAAEDEPEGEEWLDSRHRVDAGLIFIESDDFDSLIGQFGYTYNLGPNSNIGLLLPYLDSNFGESGGTGMGDLSVTWSWVPFATITAGPWVPRQVGSGISLTLPTGSAEDGRSLDTTIVTPFLGLVEQIGDSNFSLLPSFIYSYSLEPILTGTDIRVGVADLGINWVNNKNWWVTLYAAYIKDFEAGETYFNSAIEVGTVWSNGLGLSAGFNDTEFFVPGTAGGQGEVFDQEIAVNLHYNF